MIFCNGDFGPVLRRHKWTVRAGKPWPSYGCICRHLKN